MNSANLSILGSVVTSALVIVVPLVKSKMDRRYEALKTKYETNQKEMNAAYNNFVKAASNIIVCNTDKNLATLYSTAAIAHSYFESREIIDLVNLCKYIIP